ncbi:nicotinate phosphoribosyltransferase [Athelia psychrophila]|uniref:Nicotinate phosphoribosyltransferase n=1 Tax=Athelia psychrophila TaxID=1759441 RepID=A0A166QM42_9AGAM|nr:nicotinate phosphoribosyltransferase [Fibularhizoctonia sp. CBS 109695]
MAPTGVPISMLDTDLYKLTMQQAVLHHFPDAQATYRFTHRDKDVPFTRECVDAYKAAVSHFSALSITKDELQWLGEACPYFAPSYLDHLSTYRFKPEQVSIQFKPTSEDGKWGNVEIEATGPWHETIMWEVPLMACLSELYFHMVDTDWIGDGQYDTASDKAKALLKADCAFSEFGTRRRRSYYTQDVVVKALVAISTSLPGQGKVSGTSNVHLAMKHGIAPVGTIAHEWFMAVGALKGYENANAIAMNLWEDVYPGVLLVALTDTFSTGAFFKDFAADPERAKRWTGLRQDSGDPFEFAPRAKVMYESVGIAPHEKSIIFSDALNLDKALRLKQQCGEIGFKAAFGIGTFLTNDFQKASTGGKDKSKALNMVIKIASVNGKPCVKISDDLTKNTGDTAEVRHVKEIFGL